MSSTCASLITCVSLLYCSGRSAVRSGVCSLTDAPHRALYSVYAELHQQQTTDLRSDCRMIRAVAAHMCWVDQEVSSVFSLTRCTHTLLYSHVSYALIQFRVEVNAQLLMFTWREENTAHTVAGHTLTQHTNTAAATAEVRGHTAHISTH